MKEIPQDSKVKECIDCVHFGSMPDKSIIPEIPTMWSCNSKDAGSATYTDRPLAIVERISGKCQHLENKEKCTGKFDWYMNSIGRRRPIPNKYNPLMMRYYYLNKDNVNDDVEDSVEAFKNSPWINSFIHHIRRSDLDSFHDHPWDNIRIIFKGGYWENTPFGRFWRGIGIRFYKAEELHWLEIPEGSNGAWTLFIHFKRRRIWGFIDKLNNNVWVQHDIYKNIRAERLKNDRNSI